MKHDTQMEYKLEYHKGYFLTRNSYMNGTYGAVSYSYPNLRSQYAIKEKLTKNKNLSVGNSTNAFVLQNEFLFIEEADKSLKLSVKRKTEQSRVAERRWGLIET